MKQDGRKKRWGHARRTALAYFLFVVGVVGAIFIWMWNAVPTYQSLFPYDELQLSEARSAALQTILLFWAFLAAISAAVSAIRAARTADETLRHSQQSAEAAMVSAEAARVTAEATKNALDRPWVWVEAAANLSQRTEGGRERRYARLSVKNYGKAPAIIKSAKAVLFFGPTERNNEGFERAFGRIPPGWLKFPDRSEFSRFVIEHANDGMREAVEPDQPENIGRIEQAHFDAGVVLSPGEDIKVVFRGRSEIVSDDSGELPIEYAASLFLLGYFVYSSPDDHVETIYFCYESMPAGTFRRLGGVPYNTRHQT